MRIYEAVRPPWEFATEPPDEAVEAPPGTVLEAGVWYKLCASCGWAPCQCGECRYG